MSFINSQRVRKTLSIALIASFAGSTYASAASLQEKLDAFKVEPAKVMDQEVVKTDSKGNVVKQDLQQLAQKYQLGDISGKTEQQVKEAIQDKKNSLRETKFKVGAAGRAGIEDNDSASDLVDNASSMITNIRELDRYKSKQTLPVQPWSDDYWALYKGVLSARYADSGFMSASSSDKGEVTKYKAHFDSNTVSSEKMSPAEKVDKLVCDSNGTFAAKNWQDALDARGRDGFVETWMGICHGWAPAAYMESRPSNQITVQSCDGTPVTFFPSDIKALASFSWANNSPNTRFIGGRCNTKEAALRKDRASGRVQDVDCFDTNPGTMLLVGVNQIGLSKRSFVIDATFDYEVWNQPVNSFSFSYFNPQTMQASNSLDSAMVSFSSFSNDKFRSAGRCNAKNRNCRDIAYVVGVNMQLEYMVETSPVQRRSDSPSLDAARTAEYIGDIELDADLNVIGGEWYTNKHPDFLWTPEPESRALTSSRETRLSSWTAGSRIPGDIAEAAREQSANGSVLGVLVESLIAFSNGERSYSPAAGYNHGRSPVAPVTPVDPVRPNPPVVVNPPSNQTREVIVEVDKNDCRGNFQSCDLRQDPYTFKARLLEVVSATSGSAICEKGDGAFLKITVSAATSNSTLESQLESTFEDVKVGRLTSFNSDYRCFSETGSVPSGALAQ